MHASLVELLENLKPGLLWVTRDGMVRYANANASARTGLATGRRLYDPGLTSAVAASIAGRVPRAVAAVGVMGSNGEPPSELKCRVIPGLANDDAFVLVAADLGQDEGDGFDNLMQAIRTEVRDPLRQAKEALALSESHGDASAEQSALHDGLQQLLVVVDRLVELATLWNSGGLLADDRIELWPLLQRSWGEVEPLAMERRVKVRFRAQSEANGLATLYGSEQWLGRVFRDCLDAAVRSTRRHGTLDIEHRQLGPRAVVVFRDCGVFAARQPPAGTVEMPRGAKVLASDTPMRDQIGFRLCQHIVSLHGGQLREEEEDGMRNFLIELPTGAPHRSEQPQLDTGQVQQYAKDLAALMSRARERAATAALSAAKATGIS